MARRIFKSDLRDSIFRRFDENGKVIYETTFKKGTGLWKEFHNNGEVYFEIYTKDGYFTDTLRLHDDKEKIKINVSHQFRTVKSKTVNFMDYDIKRLYFSKFQCKTMLNETNKYYLKIFCAIFCFLFQINIYGQKVKFIERILKDDNKIDSLFIAKVKSKESLFSDIAFITKHYNPHAIRVMYDTCFVNSNLIYYLKKDSLGYVSKIKKDNINKYYLVYSQNCDYIKVPKDSILLEGKINLNINNYPIEDLVKKIIIETPDNKVRRKKRSIENFGDDIKNIYVKAERFFGNADCNFTNGILDGKCAFYSNNFDFLKTESMYKKGYKDGLYTVFNKDNSILYQTNFINGTGIEKIYRTNGILYQTRYFKDNLVDENSIETIYYENGKKYQEINHKIGTITKYFECNGKIYEQGKIVKIKKENGDYEYVKDGIFKYYLVNGKLEREILYVKGVLKTE